MGIVNLYPEQMYTFARLPVKHWHVHKSRPVYWFLRAVDVSGSCWVYVAFCGYEERKKENEILLPDCSLGNLGV